MAGNPGTVGLVCVDQVDVFGDVGSNVKIELLKADVAVRTNLSGPPNDGFLLGIPPFHTMDAGNNYRILSRVRIEKQYPTV